MGAVIGLLQDDDFFTQKLVQDILFVNKNQFFEQTITVNLSNDQINDLILNRATAKKEKNFTEADRIRKELATFNIILEDTPNGTTWRRA